MLVIDKQHKKESENIKTAKCAVAQYLQLQPSNLEPSSPYASASAPLYEFLNDYSEPPPTYYEATRLDNHDSHSQGYRRN